MSSCGRFRAVYDDDVLVLQVWKYYMTMAYLVVPAVPSPVIRCASPDLSLRYVCVTLAPPSSKYILVYLA